ncbi:MAG: type II toxin-antitoxin system VapC family toxin [Deltaproteobacteria bacterium]|nr:type II toxin-antitoxin system VapC family toxin [Deltaproteobacteria bacterium]
MRYLLDTNICIYIMNRRPIEIIHKFKQFNVGDIGISTITVSELQYGAVKSKNPKLNIQRVEEFLAPLEILPYDHNAANFYGEIRHNLETKGEVIGPLDMLIAAHALSNDIILVTNNDKEFKRVKNLRIENWIK